MGSLSTVFSTTETHDCGSKYLFYKVIFSFLVVLFYFIIFDTESLATNTVLALLILLSVS